MLVFVSVDVGQLMLFQLDSRALLEMSSLNSLGAGGTGLSVPELSLNWGENKAAAAALWTCPDPF